ncbi:MAG TPA: TetR/AcrR family transcriptional regulator [Caulobacteraceae bacterium]|nr:TetR/AcrR family transcriptional regulator [Caulobacteraceae bacterium]
MPLRAPAEAEDVAQTRQEIIDAAAFLFSSRGFEATTMRDVAAHTGRTSGAVYYHFDSKEDLLLAVHARARDWAEAILTQSERGGRDRAWRRLEKMCAAHMEALLGRPDYAVLVSGALPSDRKLYGQVVAIRDRWEQLFREAVAALPLKSESDRKYFRLALLGAMNHAHFWFRPDGDPPAAIARKIVALLRYRALK